MTAVKSFAVGALVIGTVAHSTLAAPVRSANLRWLGWTNHGEVAAPAPVAMPTPAPVVVYTPAPAPVAHAGAGPEPGRDELAGVIVLDDRRQ